MNKTKTESKVQVPTVDFVPHIWGIDFLKAFDSPKYRFYILNWHRRSRKTTHILNLLIREACKHPKRNFLYVAPTYKQAKYIVWRDPNMLDRYLPKSLVAFKNETELFVKFKNGSFLFIRGADNPDSLRGIDYMGLGADEYALWKKEAWEEVLRPIAAEKRDAWAAFSFTPKGMNHAYTLWRKSKQWDDWYWSELPVSRSQLIPENELRKTEEEMSPTLYKQEFECSFLHEEESVLITFAMLEGLKEKLRIRPYTKKLIANDPSTGGDENVIYVFENTRIIDSKILNYKDTMKTVGELMLLSKKHNTDWIVLDTIGIGQGIFDRLNELGKQVIPINSATKSAEPERFYNLRAEVYWHTAQKIKNAEIEAIDDDILAKQLCNVRYEVVNSNGKIKIQPKDKIKEEIGQSPDRADCFAYGQWGLQHVPVVKHRDRYTNEDTGAYRLTPEIC